MHGEVIKGRPVLRLEKVLAFISRIIYCLIKLNLCANVQWKLVYEIHTHTRTPRCGGAALYSCCLTIVALFLNLLEISHMRAAGCMLANTCKWNYVIFWLIALARWVGWPHIWREPRVFHLHKLSANSL